MASAPRRFHAARRPRPPLWAGTARRRRAGTVGGVGGVAMPNQASGSSSGDGPRADEEVRLAPAVVGDQPLGERAQHENAHAHPGKGQPHHAALPPARTSAESRPRTGPSPPRRPGGREHARHQVEMPERGDPAPQEIGHAEDHALAQHHPARAHAVHQRAHQRGEHPARWRTVRTRPRPRRATSRTPPAAAT